MKDPYSYSHGRESLRGDATERRRGSSRSCVEMSGICMKCGGDRFGVGEGREGGKDTFAFMLHCSRSTYVRTHSKGGKKASNIPHSWQLWAEIYSPSSADTRMHFGRGAETAPSCNS